MGIITISLLATLILVLTLRKNNLIEYPDNDLTSTSTAVPPTGSTSESTPPPQTTTLSSQSTTLTSPETSIAESTTATATAVTSETTWGESTPSETTTGPISTADATTTTTVEDSLLFVSDTQILEVSRPPTRAQYWLT